MVALSCVCVYISVKVALICVCLCVRAPLTPVYQSQQEKIDSIEDNVNTAAANVEEGTKSLGKVCLCVCPDDLMCACVCVVFGRWGDRWHFASQPFHSVCPYWSARIRRKAAIKEIERGEGSRGVQGRKSEDESADERARLRARGMEERLKWLFNSC